MKKILTLILIAAIWKAWGAYNTPDFSNVAEGQVILYATSWCGYCQKTRRMFDEYNVPYVEYDIEKSAKGKRQYDALKGTGVPLVVIGKKVARGYDKKTMTYYLGLLN